MLQRLKYKVRHGESEIRHSLKTVNVSRMHVQWPTTTKSCWPFLQRLHVSGTNHPEQDPAWPIPDAF